MSNNQDKFIYIPQPIRTEAVDMLKEYNFKIIENTDTDNATLLSHLKKAQALILRSGIDMTRELIEGADNLLTISRTGAGVDNIDLEAATENGIIVTSSLGVNTTSVAEHCLGLILALSKKLFLLDKELRNNNFEIRYKNYPRNIEDKKLGLIGFGRIGRKVAEYFSHMSSEKILAYDPYLSNEIKEEYQDIVNFVSMEKVLKNSDYVSVHVPLNESTRNLIGIDEFKKMRNSAYFINVSRGGVIREKELIKALDKNIIKGAALDVFENEPPEEDNPLLKMDNVILTPHAAALTEECVVKMATEAASRVITVLEGNKPKKIANPEVLSHDRWDQF